VKGDVQTMTNIQLGLTPVTDDLKFDIYDEKDVKFVNRKRFYLFYFLCGAV
jgi:hypothetical protein